MLAIAIKNPKVNLGKSNLLLGKSAIRFESSTQKRETGKQTASILYYQY